MFVWLFSFRYTIWHILSKITKDNGVFFSVLTRKSAKHNIPGGLGSEAKFHPSPKKSNISNRWYLRASLMFNLHHMYQWAAPRKLKNLYCDIDFKNVNWSSAAPGPVPSCSVVEQLTSCDRIQAVVHTLRLWWLSSPSIIILWWERWEWFHPPGEATDKIGLCERCRQELQNNRKPSRWKSQPQKVLCFCRNFYSLSSQYPCSF